MGSQISVIFLRGLPLIAIEMVFQMNAIQIVIKMGFQMHVRQIAIKMEFPTIVRRCKTVIRTAFPIHVNLQTIATRMAFLIDVS